MVSVPNTLYSNLPPHNIDANITNVQNILFILAEDVNIVQQETISESECVESRPLHGNVHVWTLSTPYYAKWGFTSPSLESNEQ